MRILRYDGPGHRLRAGGQTVERGDVFEVEDEEAERLLEHSHVRLTEIQRDADDAFPTAQLREGEDDSCTA